MIEINVNLTIDNDGNILIQCENENEYIINFTDKIINAQKIYDLLDYKEENIYSISSNINEIEDTRLEEYFADVINLFENIINDINDLNQPQNEEETNIEIDDLLDELN